jgi:hypothetical protein
MKNQTALRDMNQMLTRNSYRQPTLMQMDFVQNHPPPKPWPIFSGLQRTVDQTTGDPFYVNGASSRVIYKYDNMFGRLKKPPKLSQAVTPTDCSIKSRIEDVIPDGAILSHIYLMPPRFMSLSKHMDGTIVKPINLEDDEVSVASQSLSDLSNSQFLLGVGKRQKKVFTHSMTPGIILGEEHWETDDKHSSTVLSPNLLSN